MTARDPDPTPAAIGSGRLFWWRRMRANREIASCMEVGPALQAYLDGEVDVVSARRVARHLEMCRRCGLEAATYLAIREALTRGGREVDMDAVARLRDFGAHLMDDDVDQAADEPGNGPSGRA